MFRLIAAIAVAVGLLASAPVRASEVAIYRADDGRTWQRLAAAPPVTYLFDLLTDPIRPGHLVVATDSAIWRTDDDGLTWRPAALDAEPEAVFALARDPVRPERLWAGSERRLLASDDGGERWQTAVDGPTGVVALRAALIDDTTILYAGGAGGLTVSRDAGRSWQPVSGVEGAVLRIATGPGGALVVGSTVGLFQGSGDSVAPAPGLPRGAARGAAIEPDGTTYAAIGSTLYRRGGTGWLKMATLPLATNGDQPAIEAIVRRDDGVLLLGTDRSLYSSDGWQLVPPFDELTQYEVSAIEPDPSRPGTLYLTASDIPSSVGLARAGVVFHSQTTENVDGAVTGALGALFLVGAVLGVRYLSRARAG